MAYWNKLSRTVTQTRDLKANHIDLNQVNMPKDQVQGMRTLFVRAMSSPLNVQQSQKMKSSSKDIGSLIKENFKKINKLVSVTNAIKKTIESNRRISLKFFIQSFFIFFAKNVLLRCADRIKKRQHLPGTQKVLLELKVLLKKLNPRESDIPILRVQMRV